EALSFPQFTDWVDSGEVGYLGYLSDHRKTIRQDLKLLFAPAQSALVFLFSYEHFKKEESNFYHETSGLKMGGSVLAWGGGDYHQAVGEALAKIAQKIKESYPQMEIFPCVDTAPVLERDLAYRAGLGWFGKNSLMIHPQKGSFTIIGSLILSQKLELPVRPRIEDHCGKCQRCAQGCPTKAIDPESRTLNVRRCIGAYTIELFKRATPPEGFEKNRGYIFGCDICQEVCPWNRESKNAAENAPMAFNQEFKVFFFNRPLLDIIADIEKMSNREFKRKFMGTMLERTGREGVLKNLMANLTIRN
ncbi:MAG: QueG-associated DUF1730 domain-containing protein, partial [Pseudomonadota bacterium]